MNPCQAWQDQLWLVLDGELDEGASVTLVAHLRGCGACRDELNRAIRVQRAALMDAVGITGTSTSPTVALRAVRPTGRTQRVKRPRSLRITRLRVSGNHYVLPVAGLGVGLFFLALLLLGPGMTREVPVPPLAPQVAAIVTVVASAPISADTLAHVVTAVGVRVDGHLATSGAAIRADVPVMVDGSARLRLNDGSILDLASGSQFTIHRGGQRRAGGAIGVQVRLTTGTVDADVTPQPDAEPLVFTSPIAEVTVVGTALQVRHDATGSRIQVTHGQVRVSADGVSERVLNAGESLMVSPSVPAAVLATFFVTQEMENDGKVPLWRDQLSLDPKHRLVAVPRAGDQPPHYKLVHGHSALCLDGVTTSLSFPLTSWDSPHGLTLFLVARPTGTGADGIQRLVSIGDATGERLAVVRSHSLFGLAADGTTVFEQSESAAHVLTCTWSRDGVVTLLHDHKVVASTPARLPGTLTNAVLDIAHGAQGKHFQGNVFALEIQRGVPTEAVMHQRIDELLHRFEVCP